MQVTSTTRHDYVMTVDEVTRALGFDLAQGDQIISFGVDNASHELHLSVLRAGQTQPAQVQGNAHIMHIPVGNS